MSIFLFSLQGWLNHRPHHERDILMTLFEGSFTPLWNFALQNLEFKMEILEAFVIAQVDYAYYTCYFVVVAAIDKHVEHDAV